MSIIVQIFPQCDVCGETYPDITFTARVACRRDMKARGWKKRHGGDVCPGCLDEAAEAKEKG